MVPRRTFLATAAGAAVRSAAAAVPVAIIDTHTHFYDPARPQGVPWPPKDEKVLYRTVLPQEFRRMAKPLGVAGTIVVEASPWLEDNQYILDLAAKNPIIVGFVGNLEPGKPDFQKHLSRFQKNPLFRGIRLGSLWQRNLAGDLSATPFISDVKALAKAGLGIDAVGGPSLLTALVLLTDQAPGLRVVIDHLPFDPPESETERAEYQNALRELGKRPQVFAKVSNVLRASGDRVSALDELWEVFGPDRLIYGSNWPVSDRIAPYEAVLNVVRKYFATKGQDATEKYFRKNSQAAYRWPSSAAAAPA